MVHIVHAYLMSQESQKFPPGFFLSCGSRESGKLVKGRVAINVDGFTLDLGTLGGPNGWDKPFGGGINESVKLVK